MQLTNAAFEFIEMLDEKSDASPWSRRFKLWSAISAWAVSWCDPRNVLDLLNTA